MCLGYKGHVIKEYLANCFLRMSDVTIDMADSSVQVRQKSAEPSRITLIEVGDATADRGAAA